MPERCFQFKDSPDKCLERLKAGNERFYSGAPRHPNLTRERLLEASIADQSEHAFATVLSCSDSRVPVEMLFDVGIMDIFVIRVAGNVCNQDTLASVEFGLSYVNTPVLLVLGHTRCGAVSAVTRVMQGRGRVQEQHIPRLLDYIRPAVKRVMDENTALQEDDVISPAIEENVFQSIEELFKHSSVVRQLVHKGLVKVVGALYDLDNGTVRWLSEERVDQIAASLG